MIFPFKKILLILSIVLFVFLSAVSFLVFTSAGAKLVLDFAFEHAAALGNVKLPKVEGSLWQGIQFENVQVTDIDNLPEGTEFRVQRLALKLDRLSLKGLTGQVKNARLKLVDHEPIVINGTVENGFVDFNLFAKDVDFDLFREWIPRGSVVRQTQGALRDVDLFARGPLLEPKVSGFLVVDEARLYKAKLKDIVAEINLKLKHSPLRHQGYGFIRIDSGQVGFLKSKVDIQESFVRFDGDLDNPTLDIKGVSKVGPTKITLLVKGPSKKPDVDVRSMPPHPKEKLYLMLATGRDWSSVEEAVKKGEFSNDAAKDILTYLLMDGAGGNGFLKRFGISSFSFKYTKDQKGVGGDIKINDNVSVGASRFQSTANGTDEPANETVPNNEVHMKYQKKF